MPDGTLGFHDRKTLSWLTLTTIIKPFRNFPSAAAASGNFPAMPFGIATHLTDSSTISKFQIARSVKLSSGNYSCSLWSGPTLNGTAVKLDAKSAVPTIEKGSMKSLVYGFAAISCLCVTAGAQDAVKPPPKRTVLQQTDVAGSPAQEMIFGTVEIAPGTGNAFHTHNGTEIGYVLQGHIRLEIKGQPSRELGPGDSFLVPRGEIHRSVLLGDAPVKLINSWTVDKDKPLLVPAPQQ